MILQHLLHVHLINVICGKNANSVCVKKCDKVHILENSIGSALIPAFAIPHLSRYDINKKIPSPKSSAELPALAYMLMKRLALKLNKTID